MRLCKVYETLVNNLGLNNPVAFRSLGICYEYGYGIDQDLAAAENAYISANDSAEMYGLDFDWNEELQRVREKLGETESSENNSDDTDKKDPSGSGSTDCSYCDNSGYCPKCDGLGDCEECFGSGTVTCPTCSGHGKCEVCWGTKGEKVYVFGGENEWVECAACDGTGECGTCDGDREVTCSYCGGSGDCTLCNGSKICPYCGGISAEP